MTPIQPSYIAPCGMRHESGTDRPIGHECSGLARMSNPVDRGERESVRAMALRDAHYHRAPARLRNPIEPDQHGRAGHSSMPRPRERERWSDLLAEAYENERMNNPVGGDENQLDFGFASRTEMAVVSARMGRGFQEIEEVDEYPRQTNPKRSKEFYEELRGLYHRGSSSGSPKKFGEGTVLGIDAMIDHLEKAHRAAKPDPRTGMPYSIGLVEHHLDEAMTKSRPSRSAEAELNAEIESAAHLARKIARMSGAGERSREFSQPALSKIRESAEELHQKIGRLIDRAKEKRTENPRRRGAMRLHNPVGLGSGQNADWRRRQIILPSEIVHALSEWHGGQYTATYALMSSGMNDLVSLSMIDAAVEDLTPQRDEEEVQELIDELIHVRQYWQEHSAKEAGMLEGRDEEEFYEYDAMDYGIEDESEIETRSA
jgi:hypothetical protein